MVERKIEIKFEVDTTQAEEAIARVNRLIGETLDKIEVARKRLDDLSHSAGSTALENNDG